MAALKKTCTYRATKIALKNYLVTTLNVRISFKTHHLKSILNNFSSSNFGQFKFDQIVNM